MQQITLQITNHEPNVLGHHKPSIIAPYLDAIPLHNVQFANPPFQPKYSMPLKRSHPMLILSKVDTPTAVIFHLKAENGN